jgi:hypothetical protein
MKDKDLGIEARRKGRVLEVRINVCLDTTTALKTFRALYEVEKLLYESRVKHQETKKFGPPD